MVIVDTPAEAAVIQGSTVFIGGWAVDPSSTSPGIDRVELYLDGPSGTGAWIGSARYGTARPDVAAALGHPDWNRSGFGLEWAPAGVAPGLHTVYVYAYAYGGTSASRTVNVNLLGTAARSCAPSPSCPHITRVIGGWDIDTGGPGTYYDRAVDELQDR
jgi:hypothetical protein